MPRYSVTVDYHSRRQVKGWAKDETNAQKKAEDIVSSWNDVVSAEAGDVEEIGRDD